MDKLRYLKTFESFSIENDDYLIEEGALKNLLLGGLLSLSAFGGFYKLNTDNNKAKQKYATEVSNIIDNMDDTAVYNLVDDYNQRETSRNISPNTIDIGVFNNDSGNIKDYKSILNKPEIVNQFKQDLKETVIKDPRSFYISKDGKSIKIDPKIQGITVNHALKDIYK